MRTGASISGGLHAALILAAALGFDWFERDEPIPLTVTEIEMVRGADLDARASTAPIVQSEGPADLSPPAEGQAAPETPAPTDEAAREAALPTLAENAPPEPRPARPQIQTAPPPTPIPSEPVLPSIAEIPSPDPLDRQAAEPESPASTEPVMPLQTQAPPEPAPRPTPPPEVAPAPVETAEAPVAEAPAPEAETAPRPDPEPVQEPEPEATAEAQPEAPEGAAPREALLPVAKPAELAAAARAAAAAEQQAQVAPETPETPETPAPQTQTAETPREQPAAAAGGSQATLAQRLTRGERDALRLAIKPYYVYNGDRSDRELRVIIRVQLDPSGEIVGRPEQRGAEGGSTASQQALFQAGRRALIRAAAAGEFRRLPADKYERWKVLNFRFSVDSIGDVS